MYRVEKKQQQQKHLNRNTIAVWQSSLLVRADSRFDLDVHKSLKLLLAHCFRPFCQHMEVHVVVYILVQIASMFTAGLFTYTEKRGVGSFPLSAVVK